MYILQEICLYETALNKLLKLGHNSDMIATNAMIESLQRVGRPFGGVAIISIRKDELMEQRVINCEGDQKKLVSLIHSLFGSKKITVLPEYCKSFTLASIICLI